MKFEDVSRKHKNSTSLDRVPVRELFKGNQMRVTAQKAIDEYDKERAIQNFVYQFLHPPRKGQGPWLLYVLGGG
jgi:hypothetical protein